MKWFDRKNNPSEFYNQINNIHSTASDACFSKLHLDFNTFKTIWGGGNRSDRHLIQEKDKLLTRAKEAKKYFEIDSKEVSKTFNEWYLKYKAALKEQKTISPNNPSPVDLTNLKEKKEEKKEIFLELSETDELTKLKAKQAYLKAEISFQRSEVQQQEYELQKLLEAQLEWLEELKQEFEKITKFFKTHILYKHACFLVSVHEFMHHYEQRSSLNEEVEEHKATLEDFLKQDFVRSNKPTKKEITLEDGSTKTIKVYDKPLEGLAKIRKDMFVFDNFEQCLRKMRENDEAIFDLTKNISVNRKKLAHHEFLLKKTEHDIAVNKLDNQEDIVAKKDQDFQELIESLAAKLLACIEHARDILHAEIPQGNINLEYCKERAEELVFYVKGENHTVSDEVSDMRENDGTSLAINAIESKTLDLIFKKLGTPTKEESKVVENIDLGKLIPDALMAVKLHQELEELTP